MSHSWEEVRELLEDDFVAGDTKEHLLHAYIRENYGPGGFGGGDDVPDEVQEYIDDYSLEGGDDEGSLDEVYERAQNQSEDHGGRQREQLLETLDGNMAELTDMRLPTAEGSGVEKSDDILDLVRPALEEVFETWLPINDQVPDGLLGQHGRISIEDIRTRFDEQKGINFRKFMEDAERMRQAHAALGELNTTTRQQLTSVYQSWTGPAANASYDHYSQRIAPNTSSLLEALPAGADAIEDAVGHVFRACKDKAEEIAGLYTTDIGPVMGGAPPYIARWMVQLARGEMISQAEAKSVASWIDRKLGGGSDLENGINNAFWYQVLEELRNFSRDWIWNCFNRDLHDNIYETFDQVCNDALEVINNAYEELNAVLGEYENEFSDAGALQVMGPGTGTDTTAGADVGGAVPAGAAGSGVPGLGGGGSGAGGGGSAGGGGGAPQMPPAVDIPSPSTIPSLAGAGSGTADPAGSGSGTGGTPGMGDPAGTRPSGLEPPELPEPDDLLSPVPSQPDAGQPETVTIEDGDRTISVSSPDGQGRVTVTIDDGSGQPKTYELDFGEGTGTGAAGAVPREPEAVPLPAQVPGDTGPGAAPGAGPVPDSPPPVAGPVPSPGPLDLPGPRYGGPVPPPGWVPPDLGPMPDLPPPPTAAASVLAGPDGVARIQDGDLTIAAERPSGSPGQIVLTVDDGSGNPTTYTVDHSDPANPTSTVASGSAGGGGVATGFGGAPGFGGQAGSFGLPDQGEYTATMSPAGGGSGEAALASASDSSDRGHGAPGGAGTPMMGGMGAAAPGGGDQERSASAWRTTGDLFDDDLPEARFGGAIGGSR